MGRFSYFAAQRTHEMGIRAALGASAGSLRRLMLQRGMRLTVAGLAIGLVGMLPATDVLISMLYGIGAHDPLDPIEVLPSWSLSYGGGRRGTAREVQCQVVWKP